MRHTTVSDVKRHLGIQTAITAGVKTLYVKAVELEEEEEYEDFGLTQDQVRKAARGFEAAKRTFLGTTPEDKLSPFNKCMLENGLIPTRETFDVYRIYVGLGRNNTIVEVSLDSRSGEANITVFSPDGKKRGWIKDGKMFVAKNQLGAEKHIKEFAEKIKTLSVEHWRAF